MKPYLQVLLTCILFFSSLNVYSQKLERESRIKSNQVPIVALNYVESTSIGFAKWYKETGLKSTSYEAKFKHNDYRYSVEFSADGMLEDIEIEIEFKQIAKSTQGPIVQYLNEHFKSFKFQKIQIQYKQTELATLLNEKVPKTDASHAFEIVIKGKKTKLTRLWELTFTADGQFVSIDQILNRNSTHLEY